MPHGPRVYRHHNGRFAWLAEYRDGRIVGTATHWNERGVKTNEQILDDGRPVASKNLEGERWRLAFYCGETVSRAIDERTGDLSVLNGAVRACGPAPASAPNRMKG